MNLVTYLFCTRGNWVEILCIMLRNPINAQQENDSENKKVKPVRTLIGMLNHRFSFTLCVQTAKKCSFEQSFNFFDHFLLCYGESGKFYLNLLLLESKQDAPLCEINMRRK